MSRKDSQSNMAIQAVGEATIGDAQYCTWLTKNGLTSRVTVRNVGDHVLTFVVSGAPDEIQAMGPRGQKKFNGPWTIRPHQPTTQVQALGDFRGAVVTIMNVSNPATACRIIVEV